MPLSKYAAQFGGKASGPQKALAAMRAEYGDKKGTSVFYGVMNKRKNQQSGSAQSRLARRRARKRKRGVKHG